MAKVANLTVIRNDRKRLQAKDVRGKFYREARAAFAALGDDVAGFAVVIWDGRGTAATELYTDLGPISGSRAPQFARDVLSQHAASDLVETPPSPKDGPR